MEKLLRANAWELLTEYTQTAALQKHALGPLCQTGGRGRGNLGRGRPSA